MIHKVCPADRAIAVCGNGRKIVPFNIGLAAIFWLVLLLSGPVCAAVIQVTPDRDPVQLDETFELTFSSEEGVDDDPDFGPLSADFDILGQNQSSQVTIVNGKFSKSKQWVVSLSAKRAGNLTIPPIAFGKDRSPAISLTVVDSSSADPGSAGDDADNAEIKLEVEAEPKNPYVQAQVILTVRVLLRVNLAGADLTEPALADVLIERLGEDRKYNTQRKGRDYTVVERKYALFPQKSGLLRLDPLRLTAQVEAGGRSFLSRNLRAVRVKSEAIDLKVRPIPASFTGKNWLPAADLKLEESWPQDPPQAKAGEPLTRTLSLRAQGATVSVLPELGAGVALDASIKQYPDQPSLNEEKLPTTGISSMRQEKTALIPGKAGQFTLPALDIPWWNTVKDRMETARIPERTLAVEPSGEPAAPVAQPAVVPKAAESSASPPSVPALAVSPATLSENLWFWVALALGLGWLITALAWWRSRRGGTRSISAPAPAAQQNVNQREARQALQQACIQHDPAATRLALLAWAKLRWPGQQPHSLAEIAQLSGGVLADEIKRLNRVLYSPAGSDWRGDGLLAAIAAFGDGELKGVKQQPGLAPLYR